MNMKDYLDQLESKTLEFKEDLPSSRRLAQTVCAFANGAGGKLIIGVRDEPREIMGIASDKVIDYEERISNTIFDSIKPTVSMRVTTHHLGEEDALLLVIEVYPGNLKPSYLKGRGG
ncbi:ATP-binding protein [Candidatus Bipolaricaulota bacterium]|nr:ATP-binding protein [Candidatus Bipolaricaulota bacterium]